MNMDEIANAPYAAGRETLFPAQPFDGFKDINEKLYSRFMRMPIEERYSELTAQTKQLLWQYQLLHSFGSVYAIEMAELKPDLAAVGKACLDTGVQEAAEPAIGVLPISDIRNLRPVLVRRGNTIADCLRK